MKKIIGVFTAAILAAAVMTGCGSGASNTAPQDAASNVNAVSAQTVSTDGSTSMEKVIGYLSEAYMAENANVKSEKRADAPRVHVKRLARA